MDFSCSEDLTPKKKKTFKEGGGGGGGGGGSLSEGLLSLYLQPQLHSLSEI